MWEGRDGGRHVAEAWGTLKCVHGSNADHGVIYNMAVQATINLKTNYLDVFKFSFVLMKSSTFHWGFAFS